MPTELKTKSRATLKNSGIHFPDYNILIVDDTPINLGVVVNYLESYGFGIRIARSGETALKRVKYNRPDIILLDILMPGMDGFETCRQLKSLEATKDIPVIFMTSLTSVEDKVKGFEAGAVDYVTKPLHQEEVLARVRTHLRLQDLTLSLQEKNQQLELSSQVERERLFEAIDQQREQLRALNQKLTEVQEAERKQLARELHDEMGQALTAISIDLAAVTQELDGAGTPAAGTPALHDRLAEAKSLVDQTLEQIRELSFRLRPAMLDDLGLAPALQWYIRQYAQRVNLDVRLDISNLEERLPAHVETALYRIFQEALTNVSRHAQASTVQLRLHRSGATVIAHIEDNGRGFDVQHVFNGSLPKQGIGLLGMRERVTLLGGAFSLYSEPGHGTQVSIEIPLETGL
ncbi:MAG: response regulator [Chloroflexi bacterium]|nr:response regulator [Chloroflexota bacterium]